MIRQILLVTIIGEEFEKPINIYKRFKKKPIHNAFRKHRIIYNYSKVNFKPYIEIKYKDVITLFIIEHELKDLTNFINSQTIKTTFNSYSLNHNDLTKTATFNSDFIKETISKIKQNNVLTKIVLYYIEENYFDNSVELNKSLNENFTKIEAQLTDFSYRFFKYFRHNYILI